MVRPFLCLHFTKMIILDTKLADFVPTIYILVFTKFQIKKINIKETSVRADTLS